MRTIEVEDDVFSELEKASYLTKMPVPQIVRGLVIRQDPKPAGKELERPPVTNAPSLSPRDRKIRDYAHSPSFLASRSVMDQFLNLLSFLHRENLDNFAILQSMEGRKRKYIARSEQELENSGNSVNPKRVPNTPYWAVTNNSTDNKKLLLRQALTLLGYGAETIRVVPECLR